MLSLIFIVYTCISDAFSIQKSVISRSFSNRHINRLQMASLESSTKKKKVVVLGGDGTSEESNAFYT